MRMKEAFSSYFKKQHEYYKRVYGTRPSVCYTGALNQDLLISAPTKNGEVEWLPKLQTATIEWEEIEKNIGFNLSDELRDYYSTYAFLSLAGKFGSAYLYFQPIDATEDVTITVLRQFTDAQFVFHGTQIFLIGNATINDDDNYFIYYDNKIGKLFCYESDTEKQVLISYSLYQTINDMEALD